eukprot:jgi/Mesvir1/21967/Mv08206-RA.1
MAGLAQPPTGALPSATADLTSLCFSDPIWLQTFPLNSGTVLDYFALSPFYDATCNNEKLRSQMLDISHLPKMGVGVEYIVHHAIEPHMYILHKLSRQTESKVSLIGAYYVLDGTIYQSPHLYSVLGGRVTRCAHQLLAAFRKMETLLVKRRHAEDEGEEGEEEEDVAVDARRDTDAADGRAVAADEKATGKADTPASGATPSASAGGAGPTTEGGKPVVGSGQGSKRRRRGVVAAGASEGDGSREPANRVADARVNRMLVSVLQQLPFQHIQACRASSPLGQTFVCVHGELAPGKLCVYKPWRLQGRGRSGPRGRLKDVVNPCASPLDIDQGPRSGRK